MHRHLITILSLLIFTAANIVSAQDSNTVKPVKTVKTVEDADTGDEGDDEPRDSRPVYDSESQLLNRIKNNPKDKQAYDSLIRLYFNQNNHSARIRLVSQAIQNLGENAEYYMIIGDEYKTLKEYLKAVIAYQKAIQIQPRNSVFYNRLGLVQLKLSYFHQAEASFKAAMFYGKNISRKAKGIYINNLGVAYEARREYKDAAKYFKLCLSYHPTYNNALDNLERVTEMLNKQGTE